MSSRRATPRARSPRRCRRATSILPSRAGEPRPLGGLAVERAQHGDRDRELERRRGGEARPGVPGRAAARPQVLDVDAGRAAVAAPRARGACGRASGRASASARVARRAAAARTPARRRRVERRLRPSTAVTRTWTIAGAHRDVEREGPAAQGLLGDDVLPDVDDDPSSSPRGAVPATRPNETSRGAGATIAGGRGKQAGASIMLPSWRFSPTSTWTRSSPPWRSSSSRSCAGSRSSSAATRRGAASSRLQTTSRGSSGSTRR